MCLVGKERCIPKLTAARKDLLFQSPTHQVYELGCSPKACSLVLFAVPDLWTTVDLTFSDGVIVEDSKQCSRG